MFLYLNIMVKKILVLVKKKNKKIFDVNLNIKVEILFYVKEKNVDR